MKLTENLRVLAALSNLDAHDSEMLLEAANVISFVSNQMQSHSLHMDGTASYRFVGGWPLSSVRARSAEEALLKCVEMLEKLKQKENHGS